MGIASNGIRCLNSSQMRPEHGRYGGSAAPRGIDVKPEVFRAAEFGQLRQGIDHARRGGAARCQTTINGAKPFFRSSAT